MCNSHLLCLRTSHRSYRETLHNGPLPVPRWDIVPGSGMVLVLGMIPGWGMLGMIPGWGMLGMIPGWDIPGMILEWDRMGMVLGLDILMQAIPV